MTESASPSALPAIGKSSYGVHVERVSALIEEPDVRTAREHLNETISMVAGRLAFTTAVGLALIIGAHFSVNGHVQDILTHIGSAFLVAGIVVFGFEWGSNERRAERLTGMLVGILHKHEKEILDASAEIAIQNAMVRLSGDYGTEFADQFVQFATSVADLGTRGGWAKDSYIRFIVAFHGELVRKTGSLAELGHAAAGTAVRVDMSNALELADTLVHGTMDKLKAMGPSAAYHAVSDIATWTKLKNFNEQQGAYASELKMKRLFVLGLHADRNLSPRIISDIVYRHWNLAIESKSRYSMRITTIAQYREVQLMELREAQHLGIFIPPEGKGGAIAFLVRDEGMSNFRLTEASSEMLFEFDRLWSNSEDLSDSCSSNSPATSAGTAINADLSEDVGEDSAPDVITDYLMAYFIARMPRGSGYRGFSIMSHWRNGSYERFFQASIQAMKSRKVCLHRIFLVTSGDTASEETARLLRRHFLQHEQHPDLYVWKVCATVSPEMVCELPFGLLEGPEDTADSIRELAQPATGFAVPPPGKYGRLSDYFDEMWTSLPACEETVKTLFGENAATFILTGKETSQPRIDGA